LSKTAWVKKNSTAESNQSGRPRLMRLPLFCTADQARQQKRQRKTEPCMSRAPFCDDVLYFEGKIKQTGESIISFEDDYNKLNNNIKKSNIICLNSINSKEQNMYQEIINNGIYMLVLEKDE
jgi:hypothetical protein